MSDTQKQSVADINIDQLIALQKANIIRKMQAGDTGLTKELDYLIQLEERYNKANTPQRRDARPCVSDSDPNDSEDSDDEEPIGIPEEHRIRRYTMSHAAREQRRLAGKSRIKNGKPPAWKHGHYSRNFATKILRPCFTTCEQYPCELIENGEVEPGGHCLDRKFIIQTYSAIIDAVQKKEYSNFNDIAGFVIAQSINTLNMLLEDIQRDGTILKRERKDSEGNIVSLEYVPHPSLLMLPKLVAELGMTPQEIMITERQREKLGAEKETARSLTDLMAEVGEKLRHKEKRNQLPEEGEI